MAGRAWRGRVGWTTSDRWSRSWLEDDPEYRATWIFDQLRKLGYSGGYTIVKDLVRGIKQESSRIAYLRFETEPGRQAQVDFGEYAVLEEDGSERRLYLFIHSVLCNDA